MKHISEYIPLAAAKLTGVQIASTSVALLSPQKSPSIFGTFDGDIQYKAQAQNILEIADIARDAGAKLSLKDQVVELRAFKIIKRSK